MLWPRTGVVFSAVVFFLSKRALWRLASVSLQCVNSLTAALAVFIRFRPDFLGGFVFILSSLPKSPRLSFVFFN